MSPVSSLLWILTGIADLAHMQGEGNGWVRQAVPAADDSGQRLPCGSAHPECPQGGCECGLPGPLVN